MAQRVDGQLGDVTTGVVSVALPQPSDDVTAEQRVHHHRRHHRHQTGQDEQVGETHDAEDVSGARRRRRRRRRCNVTHCDVSVATRFQVSFQDSFQDSLGILVPLLIQNSEIVNCKIISGRPTVATTSRTPSCLRRTRSVKSNGCLKRRRRRRR